MKNRRGKDAASFQLQFCFSGDELLRYRTGRISADLRSRIFHHLNVEKCERCRDLCLTTQGVSQEDAFEAGPNRRMIDRLQSETENYKVPPAPLRLQKGQIWSTSPLPRDRFGMVVVQVPMAVPVCIVSPGNGERKLENAIRVLPISTDIHFHEKGESLLLEENSPLAYPILVEIFNESPMLAGNLGEYRGALSPRQWKDLHILRQAFLDHSAARRLNEDSIRWREKEREMTRYLRLPVKVSARMASGDGEAGESQPGAFGTLFAEIFLMPCKKAADAEGLDLREIRPCVLLEEEAFSLAVVQKGERVVLRFLSNTVLPEIFIDQERAAMKNKGEGLLELFLGFSARMPESMMVTAVIEGRRFVCRLQFRRNGES